VTDLLFDTSVAVPFLLRSHVAHVVVRRHAGARKVALTGHSLVETYSVLTRLPGDARVAPADAATLIAANFNEPALLDAETAGSIPSLLASAGVAGGAVYDALVGLTARRAGLPLATRDRRAMSTYGVLQTEVELVAG
jgi:toxin FitB